VALNKIKVLLYLSKPQVLSNPLPTCPLPILVILCVPFPELCTYKSLLKKKKINFYFIAMHFY